MTRVALGLMCGAAAGALLGVLARALMRLVAIGMTGETEYHLGSSLALVSLFVLAGAGAGVARTLGHSRGPGMLVLVLAATPSSSWELPSPSARPPRSLTRT